MRAITNANEVDDQPVIGNFTIRRIDKKIEAIQPTECFMSKRIQIRLHTRSTPRGYVARRQNEKAADCVLTDAARSHSVLRRSGQ